MIDVLLRRPVGVTAAYLLLGAIAVASLARLPVELLPPLEYPTLMVWTAYPDVTPEQVEHEVTAVLEGVAATTEGMRAMSSRSQLGGSMIRLDFGWGRDLRLVRLELRERLERVAALLPAEAARPVVLSTDPSERPIMIVALSSGHTDPRALAELEQIGREVVARRLEQLPGVARVRVTGGSDPEIRIAVAAARAAAHGVSLDAIETALRRSNVVFHGGVVRQGAYRYALEISGRPQSVDDIAAIAIPRADAPPIALGEIARVDADLAPRRGLVRVDGQESVLALIDRRPTANTVKTAASCRRALGDLAAELPGVDLSVIVDESAFVSASMRDLALSLLFGGLMAVSVLFLFLRRIRSLVPIAIAVPASLAITVSLFYTLDVSLNLISLSGLTLGIGLLVDNAIVVLENIARWREQGIDSRSAAHRGTVEVAPAITASTLTTMVIFLPITLVEGLAGRVFRDQSLAIVCAVGSSLVVALTLVPLLASRAAPARARGVRATPGLAFYESLLRRVLAHPTATASVVLLLAACAAIWAWQLPRAIVPSAPEPRVIAALATPPGADIDLLAARAEVLATAGRGIPGVDQVLEDLGERDREDLETDPRSINEGVLTFTLDPGQVPEAVADRLRAVALPGDVVAEIRVAEPRLRSLLLLADADLVIDLVGDHRRQLVALAPTVDARLARDDDWINAKRVVPHSLPAVRLYPRHASLIRHQVERDALDRHLAAVMDGFEATRLRRTDDEVPVVVQLPRAESLAALLAVPIRSRAGVPVPASELVEAETTSLAAVLERSGQRPAMRWTADVPAEVSLQRSVGSVRDALEPLLPVGVQLDVGGAEQAFRASLHAAGRGLLLSLLVVYLILAAQLENLLLPFVIMATIPLAGIGIVAALALTGQGWSLMSLTGAVVLVGIAVNDAILKVDAIRRRQRAADPLETALRRAGSDRFRPIVMTTVTTVFGLTPMAIGFGAGADLNRPIAIVIAGGLMAASAGSLLMLPVLYAWAWKRTGGSDRSPRVRRPLLDVP